MTNTEPRAALGFLLAGMMNVAGVLAFSLCFTNVSLSAESPTVFSTFGLVCIMLWGLAYLSVAKTHSKVPLLVAVFALEKFVYFGTWVVWLIQSGSHLPRLFSESPLTGVFYTIYGPNDLAFGVYFAWVAIKTTRR